MHEYFLNKNFTRYLIAFSVFFLFTLINLHVEAAVVMDSSITDTVEDELTRDLAVVSDLIDVDTRGGIVTLTGTQSNVLAKERAAGLAMQVKGVRSVINMIQVEPPLSISDDQIKTDVEKILLLDPATESYELDVKVDTGVVTLSGKVDTWPERALCESVAKSVYGVKGINNRIEVNNPETPLDDDIKLEVERRLDWDAHVDNGLINVEVDKGKVILSGTVGSASEKNMAEMAAMVPGAKDLDSSGLKVEKWARDKKFRKLKVMNRSKTEIENALKAAFRQDPRLSRFDIRPQVMNDGVTVVLRGTTDNLKAKRAAVQDARNTVGIEDVINRIKVRISNPSSDNTLKSEIYEALAKDPYVRGFDIIISTFKGVVTLRGSVDNYFEKTRIDDIASKIKGVISVENRIDVLNDFSYAYDPYLDDPYIDSLVKRPYVYKRTLSDRKIKEYIENKLWWTPFVDSDDIEVTVDDGRATLKGVVHSYTEYSIAATKAYEAGAVSVDNELTVVE